MERNITLIVFTENDSLLIVSNGKKAEVVEFGKDNKLGTSLSLSDFQCGEEPLRNVTSVTWKFEGTDLLIDMIGTQLKADKKTKENFGITLVYETQHASPKLETLSLKEKRYNY